MVGRRVGLSSHLRGDASGRPTLTAFADHRRANPSSIRRSPRRRAHPASGTPPVASSTSMKGQAPSSFDLRPPCPARRKRRARPVVLREPARALRPKPSSLAVPSGRPRHPPLVRKAASASVLRSCRHATPKGGLPRDHRFRSSRLDKSIATCVARSRPGRLPGDPSRSSRRRFPEGTYIRDFGKQVIDPISVSLDLAALLLNKDWHLCRVAKSRFDTSRGCG